MLCCQEQRVVANDYTVRWSNRLFQLAPPALPGLRGGRVVVEQRRDGTIRLRFGTSYLKFDELAPSGRKVAVSGASGTPVGLRPPSVPDAPDAPHTPHRPAPDHPWRRFKLK